MNIESTDDKVEETAASYLDDLWCYIMVIMEKNMILFHFQV